jgi:hypothetical protein
MVAVSVVEVLVRTFVSQHCGFEPGTFRMRFDTISFKLTEGRHMDAVQKSEYSEVLQSTGRETPVLGI